MGKYALKAVAGREARIGTFTAKATFTASFDAENTNDTLSGTIDEFREGGHLLRRRLVYFVDRDRNRYSRHSH